MSPSAPPGSPQRSVAYIHGDPTCAVEQNAGDCIEESLLDLFKMIKVPSETCEGNVYFNPAFFPARGYVQRQPCVGINHIATQWPNVLGPETQHFRQLPSAYSALQLPQHCFFPQQQQFPPFVQQHHIMAPQPDLALRGRHPTSQTLRASFTDAIDLTPHTPQKTDVQMFERSPTTPTPSQRSSSPLPSSVPKGPRAMLFISQKSTSTPSKRASLVRLTQIASSRSPRKSSTPSPSKSEPLLPLFISKRPKAAVQEPKIVIQEPKVAAANTALAVQDENENEVRCWACGVEGHHMMDCKHLCGHCGNGGHNSIMCRYRTLPEGKDGRVILDATLAAAADLEVEFVEKSGPLNPERADLIAKAQAAKEKLQVDQIGKKGKAQKGPTMPLRKYMQNEMRQAIYESSHRAIWESPHSEERRRRARTRSNSPSPLMRRTFEYRCETDRSPGRYRERGYTAKDYRSEHGGDLFEGPRTAYKLRGYIPEENGKWKRERSPLREGLDEWR